MSNIFFTSDTHFFHQRVIEMAGRPFESVEHMNESLVENWNSMVPKNGVVYVLGDFCFGNRKENVPPLLKALNGYKHLIIGNHDHREARRATGWASVTNYMVLRRYVDHHIVMSHYPMAHWEGEEKGSIMLHGHTHGNMEPDLNKKRLDVGVDCNAYQVIPIEIIVARAKMLGISHRYQNKEG